jgi:hypothetical protein
MIEPVSLRDQVRAAREAGATINALRRKFKMSNAKINELIDGIPKRRDALLRQIASVMTRNPDWSDEQVATALGCAIDVVSGRREVLSSGRLRLQLRYMGATLEDTQDNGRRVSPTWLRQNCSRGEKDIRQIQAIFGTSAITLAEIKLSAIKAGLPVHPTTGLVGTRQPDLEHETVCRERRFKIGSYGRKRKSY